MKCYLLYDIDFIRDDTIHIVKGVILAINEQEMKMRAKYYGISFEDFEEWESLDSFSEVYKAD